MFSIEMKINGVLIEYIYGHNETGTINSKYYLEHYSPGKSQSHGPKIFNVKHVRSQGLLKLCSLVLSKALKLGWQINEACYIYVMKTLLAIMVLCYGLMGISSFVDGEVRKGILMILYGVCNLVVFLWLNKK